MSGIETFTPSVLEVTESAVAKVQNLKKEEDNEALKLRVYVTGGGCSGFQYGFSFDDNKTNDDLIFEKDGVRVVTDNVSMDLLVGSEVDFVDDLMGQYFQMVNPNASSSCGCGTSFAV